MLRLLVYNNNLLLLTIIIIRFHVAMHQFSNRSHMTSKCGKNKKWYEPQASVSLMLLPHFDVFLYYITEQTHGNMESICFI